MRENVILMMFGRFSNQNHWLLCWPLIVLCIAHGQAIDCEKDCKNPDYTNRDLNLDDCLTKCSHVHEDNNNRSRLNVLESKVDQLLILSIIQASLVIFLMLIVLLTRFTKSSNLLKLWKKYKTSEPVHSLQDMEANRIANQPAKKSPISSRRVPELQNNPQVTSSSYQKQRTRKASEASCPDESDAVEVIGYDNLALSTSNLSGHSRSSSPRTPSTTTSSPLSNLTRSTNILDTTATTIRMESC